MKFWGFSLFFLSRKMKRRFLSSFKFPQTFDLYLGNLSIKQPVLNVSQGELNVSQAGPCWPHLLHLSPFSSYWRHNSPVYYFLPSFLPFTLYVLWFKTACAQTFNAQPSKSLEQDFRRWVFTWPISNWNQDTWCLWFMWNAQGGPAHFTHPISWSMKMPLSYTHSHIGFQEVLNLQKSPRWEMSIDLLSRLACGNLIGLFSR